MAMFFPKSKIVETNLKYAYEIKSKKYPEYNGKYIILFVQYIDLTYRNCYCRAKITEGKTIPTTKKELEQLEYVKSALNFLEEEECVLEQQLDVVPDEYGYIYQYMFMILKGKSFLNHLTPLPDDWNIEYPKNEYNPPMARWAFYSFPHQITDEIIKYYKWYNLREIKYFTEEGRKYALKQLKGRMKVHEDYNRFSKIEFEYAEKYGTDSKEYNDKMDELMLEAREEYEKAMKGE